MNSKLLQSFLALSALQIVCGLEVVPATDGTFDRNVAQHESALVMFYAPWCNFCKNFKPEYDRAAEELGANSPSVGFYKVDCTGAGKEVCARYNIDTYPTVKFFHNGKYFNDYKGPRKAESVVNFMKAQMTANQW